MTFQLKYLILNTSWDFSAVESRCICVLNFRLLVKSVFVLKRYYFDNSKPLKMNATSDMISKSSEKQRASADKF